MEEHECKAAYYGRHSGKGIGYDWIVRIDPEGCFITDPIEEWEKDDDYRDEAISNPTLYDQLDEHTVQRILADWKRQTR
ncbi:MAG: hypothetical protein AB9828_09390 [Sphaerochaetaceae bacterium]